MLINKKKSVISGLIEKQFSSFKEKIGLKNILFFLFCILILLFYLWTSSNGNLSALAWTKTPNGYHGMLAEAFLHGQTYLRVMPSQELLNLPNPYDPVANIYLRLHDASLYNGKYYLYFTPAVALLIITPFAMITGYFLSEPLITALLFYIGSIAAFSALKKLFYNTFSTKLDFWISVACLFAISLTSTIPFSLRRPIFYELCIAAAYATLMVALYYFASAITERKVSYKVDLCGLFLGLTFLSRPNQSFMCALLALGLILLQYLQFHDKKNTMALIIRTGAPMLCVIVGMLLYNYMRYNSLSEFGMSYQLAGFDIKKAILFSWNFLPLNIYNYLFSLPILNLTFPFVHVNTAGLPYWFLYLFQGIPYEKVYEYAAKLNYGFEDPIGILGFPIFYLPLLSLFYLKKLYQGEKISLLISILLFIAGSISMLFISSASICTARYMIDFVPIILLSILFSHLALLRFLAKKSVNLFRFGRFLLFFTIFTSCLISVALSFSGHGEVLKNQNPTLYYQLESFFKLPTTIVGQQN